ncbi:MAG: hypothetical protein NTAFB01_21140 [Nitrospira sp.]
MFIENQTVTIPASDFKAISATARGVLWDAKPADIPQILMDLETLKTHLWGRLVNPEPDDDALLTVPQVAERLQMSEYKIYELTRQGRLKSCKLGKSVRIRLSAVNAYVEDAA